MVPFDNAATSRVKANRLSVREGDNQLTDSRIGEDVDRESRLRFDVEHRYMQMSEAHDRIRDEFLWACHSKE
jgi:hypothetical protein